MQKFLFITGGVLSSIGKGIFSASVANLLENHGFSVAMMKFDPYLNIDPGTMNPYEHGEVYVTDDGAETDLDLGHYSRFTNSPLFRESSITSGQIYDSVIKKERRGEFLGKTVQVVPHITDEIKSRIMKIAKITNADFILIEIGGTVGDIESGPFLEAIRQFKQELAEKVLNFHLTFLPYLEQSGEFKTKPTQHSIHTLLSTGIVADFIACRCKKMLPQESVKKISLFCNVKEDHVISLYDIQNSIYEVPQMLQDQHVGKKILEHFGLTTKKTGENPLTKLLQNHKKKYRIKIALVGKYLAHKDAYKCVLESIAHSSFATQSEVEIVNIESESLCDNPDKVAILESADGVIILGGFGPRGWEGKLKAAQIVRTKKIPCLGICYGMQAIVVEYARNVLGLHHANSTEFDPQTKDPVVTLLQEQTIIEEIGGTQRLGAFPMMLKEGTKTQIAYGQKLVFERHRHRYEYNGSYRSRLEKKGLLVSGWLENFDLVECVEVRDHPWMVGVQFHPEFLSKPTKPHPLFTHLLLASIQQKS